MKLRTDINTLRVGVHTSDPGQPLSLSRVLGPLSDMAREDRRLELVQPVRLPDGRADLAWPFLSGLDVLFLEQPYNDAHVLCAHTAKLMGVKVWLDYGDDIFSVERSNPVWPEFSDTEGLKANVSQLLELADVVTAGTATLRGVLQSLTPQASNILILPECARFLPDSRPRQKVVTWRGLGSHADDVRSVIPALKEVFTQDQDWTLCLFGDPFVKKIAENELAGAGVNLVIAPWFVTPWHMVQSWMGAAPYLHIYPMPDSAFNRAKPPAVWLEASAVGAAVIGPDLPEWRVPGMIHYSDSQIALPAGADAGRPADFATVLRREMARFADGALHPHVFPARQAIWPGLTVASVNQMRWAILNKLGMGVRPPGEQEPHLEVVQ